MATRNTPGPWIATPDPHAMQQGDYMIGRPGENPDEVAVCSKRDADLISAAPELLEAVGRLLTWNHGGQRAEDVAFARRVYAKALGHDG